MLDSLRAALAPTAPLCVQSRAAAERYSVTVYPWYPEAQRRRSAARVTLARPRLLDAMGYPVVLELERAVAALHDDAQARVVIVASEGRSCSTGIDRKELAA